tara:strand:+ start:2786 stop:2932 length:147 start_codon:yes stop_codon:yes gene_type:complete
LKLLKKAFNFCDVVNHQKRTKGEIFKLLKEAEVNGFIKGIESSKGIGA